MYSILPGDPMTVAVTLHDAVTRSECGSVTPPTTTQKEE
jgi:hypothetical protein